MLRVCFRSVMLVFSAEVLRFIFDIGLRFGRMGGSTMYRMELNYVHVTNNAS